jgi:hypothetical protein
MLNTFNDTVSAINRWQPAQHYSDEPKYRDDLLEYLRKEMNSTSSYTYMPEENISVRKEDGWGLCHIAVGRNAVGIEMKKDLKGKSDVDRLTGQLVDYKLQYSDLIVVLVGKTDEEAFEYLKLQISAIKDNSYTAQQRIKVIRKDKNQEQDGEGNWRGFKPPVSRPPKMKL